jgi:hypothetical protein
LCISGKGIREIITHIKVGPSEKIMDWRQCAAVMQRVEMTVLPSCSGGGKVAVT